MGKSKSPLGLTITKILFWILIGLMVITIPVGLYLDSKGYIPTSIIPTNYTIFSNNIYTNSLAFIFSILGFLVAVIIFLIQHINSKYHAEELGSMPLFLKYFILTLIASIFLIIYNFIALFYESVFPFTIISLLFSVYLIGFIITTMLFVYYNTKVSVIMGMLSDKIIKFIESKKNFKGLPLFGEISYSEDFIEQLNKKTSIFIKNSINAIRNDQDNIFKNSLDGLKQIAHTYLEQSMHINAVQDKFLDELNDQFNFIITEALKSNNQKILEDLALALGAVSIDILNYRKSIAGINNFAINWIATLKELFFKSYSKDRTIVCHICIKEINNIILLNLENNNLRSYESYQMMLEEILEVLSKTNTYWSAVLLQKALFVYQSQFLKFLEYAKQDKLIFSQTFIKNYFDELAKFINQAKTNHNFSNRMIIFASLHGVDPFTKRIAQVGLGNIQEDKIRRSIYQYLEQFLDFNKKIAMTKPENNGHQVYEYFSESLFIIKQYIALDDNEKDNLIEKLSNDLLDVITQVYNTADDNNNKISEINEAMMDYFALLLYLEHKNTALIDKIIKKFIQLYKSIKVTLRASRGYPIEKMYSELKLFSCWINLFEDLKTINKPMINLLKEDFKEVVQGGRGFAPLLAQYNYPTTITSFGGLWYLRPSFIWGNDLQEKISKRLNGNNGEDYIKFHKLLSSKAKKKKQQ